MILRRSTRTKRFAAGILSAALLGSAVLAATALGLLAGAAGATPAWADDSDDSNMTVEVIDPNAPPTTPPPTTTPPPASGGNQGPGAASGPSPTAPPTVTQAPITDPDNADGALGEESATLAGLIYVSNVRSTGSWSLHPDGGEVRIVLVIRNVSGETVNGVARFWITTAWGWMMVEPVETEVNELVPGETRELTATLPGPGQWIFYQTHAEFIPPESVDGVELNPITRAENIIVVPWFSIAVASAVLLLGIGTYVWWRRASARQAMDADEETVAA